MTKFQKALLGVLLILTGLIWFAVEISSILLPFVLAFVLAYFLHPTVVSLQNNRVSRTMATSIITCLFCLFVISVFLILVPILQAQILTLMLKVPVLADTLWQKIQSVVLYTKENIAPEQLQKISEMVSQTVFSLFNTMGSKMLTVLTGGIVFFNSVSLILIFV